jgi:hypothetical protein
LWWDCRIPAFRKPRERVRAAIKHSGEKYPENRITVSLAPSEIRKHGAGLDLAVAVGLIAAQDDKLRDGLVEGCSWASWAWPERSAPSAVPWQLPSRRAPRVSAM